jgi:hypothetical protein
MRKSARMARGYNATGVPPRGEESRERPDTPLDKRLQSVLHEQETARQERRELLLARAEVRSRIHKLLRGADPRCIHELSIAQCADDKGRS